VIHTEISAYPIGTDSTSISFFVAKSIEAIKDLKIKHQITPMGTILEAEKIDQIFEASKIITETIHRLGVKRVEIVLKIDSRTDKKQTIEEKIQSLQKHL
jgi:uncharacterized protein (TIGR00106 family)